MKNSNSKALVCAVVAVFTLISSATFAQDTTWQTDVDWAVSSADAGGSVDCQANASPVESFGTISGSEYDKLSFAINEAISDPTLVWYTPCGGDRKCVVSAAIVAARQGQDNLAFALIAVRDHPLSESTVDEAGSNGVGDYFRTISWNDTSVICDSVSLSPGLPNCHTLAYGELR
jgi:hypothetical protein